jgi:plasmid stabilization system protein ParE
MELQWTGKALSDLSRLYEFLKPVNQAAAAHAVQALATAPRTLLDYPRIGERLDGFGSREIRRLLVGKYEIRYEVVNGTILILRLWHTRERR